MCLVMKKQKPQNKGTQENCATRLQALQLFDVEISVNFVNISGELRKPG